MAVSRLTEQEEPHQYQSAALARATPEEVAEAVAAIELRREGIGTDSIALGDAIDQLSLNATPEELLSEIQSRRKTTTRSKSQRAPRRWKLLAVVALTCSLALNVMLTIRTQSLQRSIRLSQGPQFYGSSITLRDAVDNRRPFYASLDEVRQLAKMSKTAVANHYDSYRTDWSDGAPWQVVPLEDGIYVRGWQEPGSQFTADSGTVANNKRILLSEPADSKATTKTVPISQFKDIRDPKFRIKDPVVEGTTYADRHAEGVELPNESGK